MKFPSALVHRLRTPIRREHVPTLLAQLASISVGALLYVNWRALLAGPDIAQLQLPSADYLAVLLLWAFVLPRHIR